jgi:hypothetical protein
MTSSRLSWALAACLGLAASQAQADGMRCGTKLVSDGDTLHKVRSTCGAPTTELRRVEHRTVRRWVAGPCAPGQTQCGHMVEHTIEVVIDEWTYDRGPHDFVRHLTFEQGKLQSIVTGSYGTP